MITIYNNLVRICTLEHETEEKFKRGLPRLKTKESKKEGYPLVYTILEDVRFSAGHGIKIELICGSFICIEDKK